MLAEEQSVYQSSPIRSSAAKFRRIMGFVLPLRMSEGNLTGSLKQVSKTRGLALEDFRVAHRLLAVPSNSCTAGAS